VEGGAAAEREEDGEEEEEDEEAPEARRGVPHPPLELSWRPALEPLSLLLRVGGGVSWHSISD